MLPAPASAKLKLELNGPTMPIAKLPVSQTARVSLRAKSLPSADSSPAIRRML